MSQNTRHRSAAERRADIQQAAARMGIDEAYISRLVDTFYARIQADDTLGPIFASQISDWDTHLPTMKNFWSSVALNTGRYSGRPVPAHFKFKDKVSAADFTLWLALFRQTLEDTAPSPDAIDYFMERAERIAKSLQLAMFGDPELNLLTQPHDRA